MVVGFALFVFMLALLCFFVLLPYFSVNKDLYKITTSVQNNCRELLVAGSQQIWHRIFTRIGI